MWYVTKLKIKIFLLAVCCCCLVVVAEVSFCCLINKFIMAPAKKTHKCVVCKLAIGGTNSIQCDICSSWVHGPCPGFSDKDMDKIDELPSMSFICVSCKSNISSGGVRDISNLNSKFDSLNAKMDAFITKGNEDREFIKQSFDNAVYSFKEELASCVKDLKNEIVDCNKLIKRVESETGAKLLSLEIVNNALYKKFNRSDIIIGGIPNCLDDVIATIINLAAFYDIRIISSDIHQACYINNKKMVFVKFNNVDVRDKIMKEYFKTLKTQPLKASDFVTDSSIPINLLNNRVFLN